MGASGIEKDSLHVTVFLAGSKHFYVDVIGLISEQKTQFLLPCGFLPCVSFSLDFPMELMVATVLIFHQTFKLCSKIVFPSLLLTYDLTLQLRLA